MSHGKKKEAGIEVRADPRLGRGSNGKREKSRFLLPRASGVG